MITLIATGGTIASTASPEGRSVGVKAQDLVNEAKKVWPLPAVHTQDTLSLVSSALSGQDIISLKNQCHTNQPSVITHGTDALEETAFALSLFHNKNDPPIVLTGAQRPFDDASPDGPRNLAAAIAWANSSQAHATGVTVVFADQVLPAIGVKKTHSLALNGFSAPGRGPIGVVDEAGVRKFAHPCLPEPLLDEVAPRVDDIPVVTSHIGTSAQQVEDILAHNPQGIVVEGMGSGNPPPHVTIRILKAIDQGVPVLVTSRTGAGPTIGLYAGGGADLARAGAVFVGDLSTAQARWLLAASLTHHHRWKDVLKTWLIQTGCMAATPLVT